MSQLKEREGGLGQVSDDELASLLKRTLKSDFQLDRNEQFSSVLNKKRRLKRKKTPSYRKINAYFKSKKQYWKERNRRKEVRELYCVKFLTQKQIAAKLAVSVSTVKRDLKKVRRYIRGQTNKAIRAMNEERTRIQEQEMEELNLWERIEYLSQQWQKTVKLWQHRGYRGHYTILYLDFTEPLEYGLPKLTILPRQTRNKTLAYPYKIRVHAKFRYEGRIFEADIGGFSIIQTRGW